jgi:uncharacterized membrane protein
MISLNQIAAFVIAFLMIVFTIMILYSPASPGEKTVGALFCSLLGLAIVSATLYSAIRDGRRRAVIGLEG